MRRFIQGLGVIISFFVLTISSAGGLQGLCTGFFVSSDGYIGTAAHCYSHKLTGTIRYHGKTQNINVKVISVDKENDTMLLKMDVQGVAFFKLSTAGWWVGQNIAYTGYPDPWVYGFDKSSYRGKVAKEALDGGVIVMDVWSKPGTSGSCVHDSNGACVGILTEGLIIAGIQVHTGVRPISTLIEMALKQGVPVTLESKHGIQITDEDLSAFRIENDDKVVLLNIY